MALYSYQAFSKEGKKVSGTIDASSMAHAREQLSRKGSFPISITAQQQESRFAFLRNFFKKSVSAKDKILFTKQLSVLLKSGVPLLQALELLVDHFEGALGTVLVRVKDDLKEGQPLAKALQAYPHIFDTIYVQLVRAGEASGKLEVILDRLSSYIERRVALSKKIKSALQGPLIQLGMAVVVVTFLLIKVVPQMAENFASFDRELPGPTQFLLTLSHFFIAYYVAIAVIMFIGFLGFSYWKSTASGARTIDKIKLRLPIVRYFSRMNAVVQFSHTLGMLTEGGVNLSESLDIVCNIIDNRILADALNEARDNIIKQGKIAQYLKKTHMFPSIAIYLIKTGEESGKLDFMLLTVAHNYEEELSEYADSLAGKLGPLLLIIMAGIIGFIVIAIALPIAQMSEMVI